MPRSADNQPSIKHESWVYRRARTGGHAVEHQSQRVGLTHELARAAKQSSINHRDLSLPTSSYGRPNSQASTTKIWAYPRARTCGHIVEHSQRVGLTYELARAAKQSSINHKELGLPTNSHRRGRCASPVN